MILRTIAILFFAAAILTGFILGWSHSLGSALYRLNAAALNSLQAGVQRYLLPDLWDALFVPLLSIPAWAGWAVIGLGCLATSMLRTGRG
jgi:hypothetical protein